MKKIVSCISLLVVLAAPSVASADIIYQNGFTTGDTAGWNTTKVGTDLNGETFLGLFAAFYPNHPPYPWSGEAISLTLPGVAAGNYSVQFDLFIINTWDGDGSLCCGPDTVSFSINGVSMFSGWFASGSSNSAGLVSSGVDVLEFKDVLGQVVANVRYTPSFSFYHGGGDLTFTVLGKPDQPDQQNGDSGFYDEPWALDNFLVADGPVPVPEPASLLLLASGALGLGRMLRRRSGQ
jgi:hypothetical protein